MRDTVAASPPLFEYGAVVVLVALAAWFTASFQPVLDRSLFLIFYAAVLVSAVLLGTRAGLLATALSAVSAYLLLPARATDEGVGSGMLPLLVLFLGAGWLASRLAGSLRTTLREAERQRMAANEFAATLHLRLMLAEKEIDRLQRAAAVHEGGDDEDGDDGEPGSGSAGGSAGGDAGRRGGGSRPRRSDRPASEAGTGASAPLPLPPLWKGASQEPN